MRLCLQHIPRRWVSASTSGDASEPVQSVAKRAIASPALVYAEGLTRNVIGVRPALPKPNGVVTLHHGGKVLRLNTSHPGAK